MSLTPDGIQHVHQWPLSDEQQAALHESAEFVRQATAQLTRPGARTPG